MNIKKQTKKTAIGLLVLGQIMTTGALAAPQEAINSFKNVREVRQNIGHFKGEIKLFIEKDGKKTRVDQNMKDGLRVVEGRTCVGVRDLVNAIEGAEVEWDQANKIVDITYDGKSIFYPLGKPVMWDGDKMVTIDVPAQVDPSISRTFLPIRNIAETLGFKVDWNQKTKEVTLTPGAGTGQTTTTQQNTTKPKVNTKAGTYTTSTGYTLPKFGIKPKGAESYPIGPKDFTDNGDDTLTFAKGTEWERIIPKLPKRVTSSPANPNFRIIGSNGKDDRINTYIIGPGEPHWEEAWKKKLTTTGPYKSDGYEYSKYIINDRTIKQEKTNIKFAPGWNIFINTNGAAEMFSNLIKDREIKGEYVNEFLQKGKFIPCDENIYEYDRPKVGDKFYDVTGIIDPSIWRVGYNSVPIYNNLITGFTDYFIMDNEGNYYQEIPFDKDIIVDKYIFTSTLDKDKKWFIIDLTNYKFKHTSKVCSSINYSSLVMNDL